MAYPSISGPYGFKPVNLIGGQVYSGSTREYAIQYNYATSIFYGDFVTVSSGLVTRASITSSTSGKQTIGVFLGCSYTNPTTKQRLFSQYYPANTAAGDIKAIVADDPDIVIKAAMVTASGGTTIASASQAIVGLNLAGSNLAGNINTGDSYNALVAPTATPSTGLPFRILSLVPDTATAVTATGSSSSTTITLTGTGLPSAIPQGADVAYLDATGQLIQTGSFVANSGGYAAGTTSIAIDKAIAVPGSITAIPSSSTIVFTSYPEVLVKINFGIHNYYAA
jgi:hypothetical protein